MASRFTELDIILWLGVSAAEAFLFVFLLKRALYRQFPIFFSFVCFGLIRELVMFFVAYRLNYASYFYSYWAFQILEYLFQFGILYEVTQKLFGPLEIVPPQAFKLFLAACFSITAILAGLSIMFPEPRLGPVLTLLLYLDRGSEFIKGSALLLLLPFASMLGLRWKHYTLGIVLGFGLVATVNIVCSAVGATLFRNIGAVGLSFTRYIPKIAEISSFVIWIEYFRKPEPVRSEVRPEVLTALKGVSNQLEDLYTSPVGMVRRLMWQSSLQR